MCGGGGKGTGGYTQQGGPWGNLTPSQQQTQVASPEAIGWYQQAMKQAQQAAAQPFQQFGTRPEEFVAQLTPQQIAAQQGIQQQAAATQPFAQMGAGMQAQAGMGSAADLAGAYMSPYMAQVVDPVRQALQQQQGQQLAQQQAEAIRGGAFGGERAGLQRQLLRGQQQLGLGQALSPLYQTGYGQALGAAQTDLARQIAAGQGLTQAGLQAQQASLGAGTLAQQTAQAGINALYNQFQQQRAYPFQTAQFLAGIAGGLGPLLGQTSYQAQATNPFGAFLARGGSVSSRMGGAVHEAGDYADGGVPSGADIDSILAAQEKMYQGADKVSGTEIPTGGVQAARGLETVHFDKPQEQKSVAEKIKSLTGAAKDIFGMGKDIYGALSGASGSESGGMGSRAEEDSGSSSGLGSLAKAAAKMGLSAAANYFLPGSGFLTGLLPFADGGAVGYADGGDAEDDDIFERGLLGAESGRSQFDKKGRVVTSPKGALGIAQIMPGTAPEAAKLAGLDYDPERLRSDEAYNKALGRAYYNEQLRKFGTPELALAAYNAGPGRVQKALEQAGPGGDVMSLLPRETQAYVPRALGLAGVNADEAIRQARARDRGFMALDESSRQGVGAAAPEEGLFREENVLPAISGLGAALEGMVTSPTVGIGGALLRGAGAGMKEGVRSALEVPKIRAETGRIQAEIPRIGAETKLKQAETAERLQDVFGKSIFQRGDMWFVRQADGNVVSLYDWMKSPKPVWGGEGGAPAAEMLGAPQKPIGITPETQVMPQGNVNYGPASQRAAQEEQRALYSLNPQRVKEQSAKYLDKVNEDAAAAQQQKIYHNDIAKIIAEASLATGMGTMGAAAPLRAQITDYLNTAARSAGIIPSDASMFGENDTQSEMLKKLQTLQAQAGVSAAGQKAYGSLVTLIGTLPSLEQTPQAAAFNAASNLVNNQRLVDKQLHAQAYGQNSGEMYYHAGPAFERDNAPSKYVAEQNALSKMMLDKGDPEKNLPSGAKVISAMTSGAVTPEQIEDYFMKKYKLKGMSRYFVGPQ